VSQENVKKTIAQEYQYGFVTDIDTEELKPGLSEEVIKIISAKKMSRNLCSNGGLKLIGIG
jgi:Fe-S cluster assembly protein SufB